MTLKPQHAALDRPTIHARALRAAAAVAFGAACSSGATQTIQGTESDSTVADSKLSGTDSVVTADGGVDALADQQAAGGDAQGQDLAADSVSAAADQSATADIQAADVATADGLGVKPDCTAPGQANGPCCLLLQDWCSAAFPKDADMAARNACIFGENFSGTTGCTPWGPPAPPEMGWA